MNDDARPSKNDLGNTYLQVTYGDKPFTSYPYKLSAFLFKMFGMGKGEKILDLGCGRGEFLDGFQKLGMITFGIDQAGAANSIAKDSEIKVGDIEERLPYPDNHFDLVFSKSVLEHFYYPEKILLEVWRVLKPGGRVISMTPDWYYCMKEFHDDFSHRTPFTLNSLAEIHLYAGFKDVESRRFIQLPAVWKHPSLQILVFLTRTVMPSKLKKGSKWVRFSKEVMLLASGTKSY
jgi:SAM-dependent methyltransferase